MSRKRLFDDNLYRFDTPQASYWEATAAPVVTTAPQLAKSESCDVAIIGGGYTGLSAALHLARDYGIDVRVLEAGHIGWGASGRNGGFCCIGGTGVQGQQLIDYVGLEPARDYYRSQVEAVDLVRALLRDEALDVDAAGSAEIEVAHTERAAAHQALEYDVLKNALGMDVELLTAAEVRERHFACSEQYSALLMRPSFGLHALSYCRGLAAAAVRHGAQLHAGSEVRDWQKDSDGWHRLQTPGGALRARRVISAANGFIQEDLNPAFLARTLPAISAIIVTRPLAAAELAAQQWQSPDLMINSRRVLNYFRLLPDNRLLFGGRGHGAGHPDGEARTYRELQQSLWRLFPAWTDIGIDYRWHGLICMTRSLCPSIGCLDEDDSVFFGFGYHGNGVNTATWSGKQLADWIGRGRKPDTLPAIVSGLPPRFPAARFRAGILRLGIAVANWLDNRR